MTAVEIVERAKACLEGKIRSYVEDAKVFAKIILAMYEGAATPSPCASSETSGGGGGPSAG